MDITPIQGKILDCLKKNKTMSVKEISEMTEEAPSTLYDNLLILIKRKIIQRDDQQGKKGRPKYIYYIL